jgi:N-acylneuraminate cytidylyltransferase
LLHFASLQDFDILVFIQPTSPLIKSKYINQGLKMVLSGEYDSVFSVYEEHWIPRWNKDGTPDNWNISNRPMRQDIPKKYVENGAFYITSRELLLKNKNRYSGRIGMVEMAYSKSFQVDSFDDLLIIEKLLS